MKPPRDQHFLADQGAVRRIVALAEVSGQEVLEIGPGEGILTRALIDRGARVHAVEIDPDLCDVLRERFAPEVASGQLIVIRGDAVRCPLPPFTMVVSNLPYSASSKLTFRLLGTGFDIAVLMYQSEFARRMIAVPGTKDYGRLSVMVQTYARVEPCFELSPESFRPKPRVRSMVVRVIPKEAEVLIPDRSLYSEIVRVLFMHRRKTVRNGLKGAQGLLRGIQVTYLLSVLPPDLLNARPEMLTIRDFAMITRHACEVLNNGEK